MEYLHYFASENEYNYAKENNYKEPWVSAINTGNSYRTDYNKTEREKLLGTPLTFEIISDGNICWKAYDTAYTVKIEYKKNNGEWTEITSSTGGTNISVVNGDTVQFRGNNALYYDGNETTFSGTTAGFKIKGNIMSLINSTGFTRLTTLESEGTFRSLFNRCSGLTDASNLVLPATTLSPYCYYRMFYGCTSLTTAPELPATTLVEACYCGMFRQCKSLITAPELPATLLVANCYDSMFYDCKKLNYIKCLAINNNGTSNWVDGVASSGTFVKAASMNNWPTGNSGIPENWVIQDAN